MKRFHIMILSIGSLLGQNMLDALEGRRHNIRVTGLNSVADNPRVFRCDHAYLVPPAESKDFEPRLLSIIRDENPDAIFPGRDNDILILARLRRSHPTLAGKIPLGSLAAAKIMDDKLMSYRFAVRHGLPFVPTVSLRQGEKIVVRFADEHGYPLIAKPSAGFGSQGILILTKPSHLKRLFEARNSDTVLQPFIGINPSNEKAIANFDALAESGVPFFFHLPDDMQYASQTLIGPDGRIGDPFCSISTMILGRCEKTMALNDPEFSGISLRYARAIAEEGWTGMFNLQCRKTPAGYFGIELNGRMSGSTSARALLGYDEARMYLDSFYSFDIGDTPKPSNPDGIVYRVLMNAYVSNADSASLRDTGQWRAGKKTDRIVLTGASGYIGRELMKMLQDMGFRIIVLTRSPQTIESMGLDVEIVASSDYKAVPWHQVETLIHLGFALPHHGQSALNESMEYSAQLLEHAARSGVRSIIFISSRSVYGTSGSLPMCESTLANPSSPYGVAKRAVELIVDGLRLRYPDLGATIVRLGAVNGAGAGNAGIAAISKFVKSSIAGEQIVIEGGEQKTDLLDIRDAVQALSILVACPPDQRANMYVLSSFAAYTIRELAQICVNLSGNPNARILMRPDQGRPSFAMDPSRFASQFGWSPKYGLDDTVRTLMDQICR